ncbi:MAG: hypothetical protein ACQETI_03495 [Halobacteriota archaeon]
MKLARLFHILVSSVGLSIALFASFLLMRGPFFGGDLLDPVTLFGSLIAFLVGVMVASWGTSRMMGVGARV